MDMVDICIACGAALIVALAFRYGGRKWLIVAMAIVLLVAEGLALHQRALVQGTPYQFEEELWVTILTVALPLIGEAAVIAWSAAKRWPLVIQVVGAAVSGVLLTYPVAFVLYTLGGVARP